jgi:hypothetical protein
VGKETPDGAADERAQLPADVARFIENQIDSVPHMEALLLLWECSPETWTAEQLASRIYMRADHASQILHDLARRQLARPTSEAPARFAYDGAWDEGVGLMARVAEAYRRHLVLVAQMIHSKASGAIREFARAFEIKKEG